MVALSRPFTVIADSSVDPDSPLTTTLMVSLQENDIHLEEWLGLSASVKIADHAHAGFDVDGTAVISTVALVFDQITNQSAGPTGASFIDVATITVASADLPSNRDAMIIASGGIEAASSGAFPVLGNVRLLVAGVAKQTIPVRLSEANDREIFALSEIVNLATGSDRIIKVQANSTTNNFDLDAVNLFSVLIT